MIGNVERSVARLEVIGIRIDRQRAVRVVRRGHAGLGVRGLARLEEVGAAVDVGALHKLERVLFVVQRVVAEHQQKAIRDVHDVLFHELGVHTDHVTGNALRDEADLDVHGALEHVVHDVLRDTVDELRV